MAYPGNFHRLVIAGTLYGDTFNTSLSIVPDGSGGIMGPPAVTPTLLTDVAKCVSDFWTVGTSTNVVITASAVLKSIKLNEIKADGHYKSPVTNEHIYPAPMAGKGSPGAPAQIATVATIRTAAERGLASKGRMYLPPCGGFWNLDTDGRATVSDANRVCQAVVWLGAAINEVYAALPNTDASRMRVGVASSTRAGEFRVATAISVGRVPDTMRSRRSKSLEAPVQIPYAA